MPSLAALEVQADDLMHAGYHDGPWLLRHIAALVRANEAHWTVPHEELVRRLRREADVVEQCRPDLRSAIDMMRRAARALHWPMLRAVRATLRRHGPKVAAVLNTAIAEAFARGLPEEGTDVAG